MAVACIIHFNKLVTSSVSISTIRRAPPSHLLIFGSGISGNRLPFAIIQCVGCSPGWLVVSGCQVIKQSSAHGLPLGAAAGEELVLPQLCCSDFHDSWSWSPCPSSEGLVNCKPVPPPQTTWWLQHCLYGNTFQDSWVLIHQGMALLAFSLYRQ